MEQFEAGQRKHRRRSLELKEQPGKDILILGSGSIVSALTSLGLIDEYEFIVNPVVLGSGRSQFMAWNTSSE
jgi:dihydrofolate reductase